MSATIPAAETNKAATAAKTESKLTPVSSKIDELFSGSRALSNRRNTPWRLKNEKSLTASKKSCRFDNVRRTNKEPPDTSINRTRRSNGAFLISMTSGARKRR